MFGPSTKTTFFFPIGKVFRRNFEEKLFRRSSKIPHADRATSTPSQVRSIDQSFLSFGTWEKRKKQRDEKKKKKLRRCRFPSSQFDESMRELISFSPFTFASFCRSERHDQVSHCLDPHIAHLPLRLGRGRIRRLSLPMRLPVIHRSSGSVDERDAPARLHRRCSSGKLYLRTRRLLQHSGVEEFSTTILSEVNRREFCLSLSRSSFADAFAITKCETQRR